MGDIDTGENGSIEALLDLDGEIFMMDNGYRAKFEVKRVSASPSIPHGVTLHDRNNVRVLGFDNAHAIKPKGRKRKRFSGRKVTWDHKHLLEKVEPYQFETASRLIEDFWSAVDKQVGA